MRLGAAHKVVVEVGKRRLGFLGIGRGAEGRAAGVGAGGGATDGSQGERRQACGFGDGTGHVGGHGAEEGRGQVGAGEVARKVGAGLAKFRARVAHFGAQVAAIDLGGAVEVTGAGHAAMTL